MILEPRLRQALGWAVAQLDERERANLRRLVLNDLHPDPAAAARRAQELGPLAAMLAEIPPDYDGFPTIRRSEYDQRRPPSAPMSGTLVRRYGRWHVACASAYLVHLDGTYNPHRTWPHNRPWPQWNLGLRGRRPYANEEVVSALIMCAEALGRIPSCTAYLHWSRARRRRDREVGLDARLPDIAVFKRLFPRGGFHEACALAFPDDANDDKKGTT